MTPTFFAANRARIMAALPGALLMMTAYDALQQSGDMAAPFLQEANFFWLTGITEAGWKAVIDGTRGRLTLVRPAASDVQIIFDGMTSDEEIVQKSGANEIIHADEFEAHLRQLARKHSQAYTVQDTNDYSFVHNPAQAQLHKVLQRVFVNVTDCGKQLAGLRAIKSTDEIAAIRRAIAVTRGAFTTVRSQLGDYRHEYEIEADMTRAFRRVNATHAYEPIVAAGQHAVTLHYTANAGKTPKNKGVLLDVGARVDGYAADITRTYCANPTKQLVAVHAAVERAHQAIIATLTPGLTVVDYMAQVDEIMKDALMKLGLLTSRDDTVAYRKYFPHAVSHGLGVDVHDSLGAPRYFAPGMVLTVEPGIYVPEWGIGVRIEDDVLVTENGHENLSRHLSTAL